MEVPVIESKYPISFREKDAVELGRKLRHRNSVELIGMKRVGIRNFLRFFLYHKDIVRTYIKDNEKHLFVPIDMNDLVEREIFPFWTLTFKRIVDAIEQSAYSSDLKNKVETLFLSAIQSHDLFLLIDNVRRALSIIVESDIAPTLFFLRFDRMKDNLPISFFDNLQGLRESTNEKLTYIFTCYRSLDDLFPASRSNLSVLSKSMYITPAEQSDAQIIYDVYKKQHHLNFPSELEKELFAIIGGHVQYLQMAMVILNEKKEGEIQNKTDLFRILVEDERIALQSEELWESMNPEEQKVLLKISNGEKISQDEREYAEYLWKTGFVREEAGKRVLFTPLFTYYLETKKEGTVRENNAVHLTKKEHILFTLLEGRLGDICEREEIIEKVWPEYKEFGVSDWAIDRLVARVRVKLREQKSPYEIVTVRTRGYKLSTAKE